MAWGRNTLRSEVTRVVTSDRCMGCGVCAQLDDRISLACDPEGFLRPRVRDGDASRADERRAVREFRRVCPGVAVHAGATPDGGERDPFLGPVLAAWDAWATDPEFRHRGSSGGVLSALTAWLVSTGEAAQAVASDNAENPRRTLPIRVLTRDDALASAGSRYTPCANASHPDAAAPDTAFVGKPCEASGLRRLVDTRSGQPLILSFFCAGTPSALATDRLVAELGIPAERTLSALWYRGRGWPGRFTAVADDGTEVSTTYDDSWGRVLGRSVAWRCRLCADGVGESADITAGDHWHTGEAGYPQFDERQGRSVLIARTPRGLDVIRRAVAAGVIEVAATDLGHVRTMQPYQVDRRRFLVGRLLATVASGRRVTRYRGFSLWALAKADPRGLWRQTKGTLQRARRLSRRRDAGAT